MAHEFIDIKGLTARIKVVRQELADLLHLDTIVCGKPRRGRPAGTTTRVKTAKRGKRSKRGALGESILKFVEPKGKAGAHIKDIAAAVGTKPANVTAWAYSTGKGKVKKVARATFAAV